MTNLRYFNLTAFILFFCSLLLRIAFLRNGPFDIDCLNLVIQSQNILQTSTPHTLYGPGYPLLLLLSMSSILISQLIPQGDPFVAVNLMSAVFGSLSVSLFYKLLLELRSSPLSALMGGVILSVCPMFLDISLFGMGHTPTVFFLLAGLLFLLKHQRTEKRNYLWLSSFCIGLMGAVRFQDMVLMMIPLSFLYWRGPFHRADLNKADCWVKYFLFWLQILCIIILLHLPLILSQNYLDQFAQFFRIGITENTRGLFSPSLLRAAHYFILNFTWVGLLSAILGLILLIKHQTKLGIFCLLWILIPLEFYGNLWSTAPRFLNIILPAMIMAQMYLLSRLMTINKIFFIVVMFLFGVIIFVPFQKAYPKMNHLHTQSSLPDFGRWIANNTEKNAIIIPADEGLFIEYFGQRKIVYRPGDLFSIAEKNLDKFQNQLNEWLDQDIPIYITYDALYSYNPDHIFSNRLQNNYLLETVITVPFYTWHFSPFGVQTDFSALIQIKRLK